MEKTEFNNKSRLGPLLKKLLSQKALSMRKFSQLTGIDTATISRIANQKQQANIQHIQLFAEHLQVPINTLLAAAGYKLEDYQTPLSTDMHHSIETIQEVLVSSNLFDETFKVEQIQKALAKYEQYARTKEGKNIIEEEFEAKVEQVSGAGPFIDQLKNMYEEYLQGNLSEDEQALLGSVLLYFILSTDIIPDYVFPVGFLDDALAVQLVLAKRASSFPQSSPQMNDQDIK